MKFEPGARTHWHRHPGGQLLLVIEGVGYYQGQPRRVLRRGDVMNCLPGVAHWHGALRRQALTHLAIVPITGKGAAVWLQHVSEVENNGRQ